MAKQSPMVQPFEAAPGWVMIGLRNLRKNNARRSTKASFSTPGRPAK